MRTKGKRKSVFRGKTRKNANQRKRGSAYGFLQIPSGVDVFTLESNKTKIVMDIMPYEVTDENHPDKDTEDDIASVGSLWYKRPLKIHRNVGVNHTSQICLTSIGKKCPICEFRETLRKRDDVDDSVLSSLRPSRRNLYCIRVRSIDGRKEKGKDFKLFEFSDKNFQEMFEGQLGDKDEFDYFPDPFNGVSVYVNFDEDSFAGNKYAKPTRFEFEEREEQYEEEDLNNVPNLDDCLKILDYDELKDMFFEGDTGVEPDADNTYNDDEEEPEKKTPKATRRKRKSQGKKDEGLTVDDLDGMDIDALTDYCEKEKLKIDPYDYAEDEVKELRQDIADELGLAPGDETEKEDEPEEDECPYGHTFGKDNDRFDDCDDCDKWNECKEAKKQRRKR